MTFDAEMEERLEKIAQRMEQSQGRIGDERDADTIRALLADWKQRGDYIDQLQQEQDEINVALGPGSTQLVSSADRLARIKALREENERLLAKVKRLEARGIEDMHHSIEAALALHQKDRGGHCETCDECVEPEHPCNTFKALKGEK